MTFGLKPDSVVVGISRDPFVVVVVTVVSAVVAVVVVFAVVDFAF